MKMPRLITLPSLKKQQGLSLIELLVALLVSSLLVFGLVAIFISGRASFLTQEQQARQQENGRFAWNLISQELQRAGYYEDVWDPPELGFTLINSGDPDKLKGTLDNGNNPDQIEFQYESNRDCYGTENAALTRVIDTPTGAATVPAAVQKVITFSVNAQDQLVFQCYYAGDGNTLSQQIDGPIAQGIENLQIQYGIDSSGDLSANSWLDFDAVSNVRDIVAVRLALLVVTPNEFTTDADDQTFDLYSHTTTAVGDRRIRKVFAGQVNLRNLTL